MVERLLDVIKWGLVIVIAGVVFYLVYPKYYFESQADGYVQIKGNKVTGEIEVWLADKTTIQRRYREGKWHKRFEFELFRD